VGQQGLEGGPDPGGGRPFVIEFLDEERVELYDGCNWSINATYSIDDGRLRVPEPLFMTVGGCGEAVEDRAAAFMAIVRASPAIDLDGDRLRLASDVGTLVFFEGPNPTPYCCRPEEGG
jgi:heat shock protein HslJ